MEEKVYEVSLGQLFRVALKHWWVILLAVVVGVAIAFAYVSFFVQPMYTTFAKVGVNNVNMSAYQDALAGQYVANDSASIITGNVTLEKAASKLNESEEAKPFGKIYTAAGLATMIKTTASQESRYFDVQVTSDNPVEAKVVCSYIVEAFREVLEEYNVMDGADGIIIHKPVTPTAPSSPNKTLSIVLGALIGFVLSFGVLLVIHFAKDALDGEDWLIEVYNEKIPMLAVIPDANSSGKSYRKYSKKYGYGYGYPQK